MSKYDIEIQSNKSCEKNFSSLIFSSAPRKDEKQITYLEMEWFSAFKIVIGEGQVKGNTIKKKVKKI